MNKNHLAGSKLRKVQDKTLATFSTKLTPMNRFEANPTKSRLAVALALGLCLGFGGCKPTHSLEGKWSASLPYPTGTLPATFDMKADGTWTGTLSMPGLELPGFKVPPLDSNLKGTYKLDADTLTIGTSDAHVQGAPDFVKSMIGPVESSMKQNIDKYSGSKAVFTEDNKVVLTNAKNESITLTRVK